MNFKDLETAWAACPYKDDEEAKKLPIVARIEILHAQREYFIGFLTQIQKEHIRILIDQAEIPIQPDLLDNGTDKSQDSGRSMDRSGYYQPR